MVASKWQGIATALILAAALPTAVAADAPQTPQVESAGKPQARLALGAPAPEIAATTLERKPIALAGLRGDTGQILVLQFGSLTEPLFRAHADAVEKLANKLATKAQFVIVYSEEAHPADTDASLQINHDAGFDIAQPVTLAEREKLAQQTIERLNIHHQTVVVDAWNNTSSLRYGSYPNMTFIIDAKGNLQAGYPWMDVTKVQAAVETLAAGKPLPPDLKGSVKLSAAAPLDFTGAALDMTGGRGPGSIAIALDKLNLNDNQRRAIYPALAEYLADLQEFRVARTGQPGPGKAATTKPTDKPTDQPTKDPQAAMEALHTSAAKLKDTIKNNLNDKDATVLLDALEQGQAQHLFARP